MLDSRTGSPARRTSRVIRLTSMSADAQRRRRALRGEAQLRAHAGRELGERERLDEVVDRARVESGDAILDLAARGEHDHGHVRLRLPQRAEDLQAGAAGEHQVEHDQVEALAQRAALALDPVEGSLDGEPLGFEAAFDEVDDSRLVLDQENHRRA